MTTPQEPVPLPKDRGPTLRIVPMPQHTNFAGNIFGGWVFSQVDIAGSIPAIRRARGRVTTVAVRVTQAVLTFVPPPYPLAGQAKAVEPVGVVVRKPRRTKTSPERRPPAGHAPRRARGRAAWLLDQPGRD